MRNHPRMPIRRAADSLGLLVLLGTILGCHSPRYLDRQPNPIDNVHRIAIAPLMSTTTITDIEELDGVLTGELARFPRVDRVIPPREVGPVVQERRLNLRSELDLRHLATLLGVDAVLVVEITGYEWIVKPRLSFLTRLFIADSPLDQATVALDMSRGGRMTSGRGPRPGNLIELEQVYDAAENRTRDQIWWYSLARNGDGQALTGVDRILRVPNEYFQFASFSLINALFGEYSRRLEEVQRENT